jgi:hypothetical protein
MNEQIKSVYAPNEIEMTLLFLIMGWHHCVDFQYVCGWIGSIANVNLLSQKTWEDLLST